MNTKLSIIYIILNDLGNRNYHSMQIYLIALNYTHNPFIGQIFFTIDTPVHNRTIFNQQ